MTASDMIVLEDVGSSHRDEPEMVHDFYQFTLNLRKAPSVDFGTEETPSLFRAEQIDSMNAFGEGTERDAFE